MVIPAGGNVCNKPLDSGLRRNDGEGNRHGLIILLTICHPEARYLKSVKAGIHSGPFKALIPPPSSFRRRPESRKAGRDVRQIARVTFAGIIHKWSFPPGGNVCNKPLDSGLRQNDGEAIDTA